MRPHSALLAIAVVCCLLLAERAEATAIIFTDRAAFEAATRPNVLVTFDEDVPFVQDGPGNNFFTLVLDDILHVSFFEEGGFFFVQNGSLDVLGPVEGAFDIVGGSKIRAIGFDVSAPFPPGRFGIGFDHERYEFGFISPTFIGLALSTPVDSVSLFNIILNPDTGFDLVVDNMVISTPEPATLLLFGSAAALMQGVRYHLRSSASTRSRKKLLAGITGQRHS